MRVLFVDPILRTAEAGVVPAARSIKESLPYNYCSALHDQGHEVTLVSCEEYRPLETEEYPFRVVFLKSFLPRLFPPRAVPFMPGLWKLLRGKGGPFDLVVCGEIVGFHSLMAALVCPKRTLIWHELALHQRLLGGIPSRLWYPLTAPLFRRVACIVPRSANARRFLLGYFPRLAGFDVEHGVDGDLFVPTLEKQDRFLVVANLVVRKRVDQVIHSFARYLGKTGAATALEIVGDGPLRGPLEDLAARLGIGSKCRFHGRLSHREMAHLLSASKALLFKGYKDNSLLTVAESIAAGTPVLITGSIDNARTVRLGRLGLAVDEWDVEELEDIESNHHEYAENCRRSRHIATVRWQSARLVEAFRMGNKAGSTREDGAQGVVRPRIVFLSQNCFVQCDLGVVPALRRRFDLRWNVFFPAREEGGFKEAELESMASDWGVQAEIIRLAGRLRSFGSLLRFLRLAKNIRQFSPDLVYVNATGFPWLAVAAFLVLDRRKILWAIHDVQDHRDKSPWSMDAIYKRFLSRSFGGVHLLSKNQKELFAKLHPGRDCYYAPHPPIDLGEASFDPPSEPVRFLFFGFIGHYKGVDLLIDAAQRLWEQGVRGFEVVIAGRADDWMESYAGTIRIPEIFRLEIGTVPNQRVPVLFGETHWLVLPYRDATQSGPLALSMHYNRPAIVSDLPAFREFVDADQTGMFFAAGQVEELALRLRDAVLMGKERYGAFRETLGHRVETEYSLHASSDAYAEIFGDFLARRRKGSTC